MRFFNVWCQRSILPWVQGSATDVPDAAVLKPFRQIAGDVRGTVVAQQPWSLCDLGALAA